MILAIPRVISNWDFAPLVQPCVDDSKFVQNGYGRRYAKQTTAPYWEEAFAAFGLKPEYIEPRFQNMTGNHFLDGACTHKHCDPAPDGYAHVRCNVMLKKPMFGGNPILDGESVQVNEHDLWLCLASLEEHASEPIRGSERVIFSFGGIVPLQQINNIL